MSGRLEQIEQRLQRGVIENSYVHVDEKRDVLLLVEIARAARVMSNEAGGRMEGQAWLDLRAALARLDSPASEEGEQG